MRRTGLSDAANAGRTLLMREISIPPLTTFRASWRGAVSPLTPPEIVAAGAGRSPFAEAPAPPPRRAGV